jgi:hypothetical protein
VPDKAQCLWQSEKDPWQQQNYWKLRLINDDQTLVGLTDKELFTWCVETGKIAGRVLLPQKGISIDAKCYPFIFIGFESGSILVVDLARSLILNQTAFHPQPVRTLVMSDDHLRLVVNSRRVYHIVWEYTDKSPAIPINKALTLGLRRLESHIEIRDLRHRHFVILHAPLPEIECENEDERNKISEQLDAQNRNAADHFIGEHFGSLLDQWRMKPNDPSPLRKIAQCGFALHQEQKSFSVLNAAITLNDKHIVPLADLTGVYLDLGRLGRKLGIPASREYQFYRSAIVAKPPSDDAYRASGELKSAACKHAGECDARLQSTYKTSFLMRDHQYEKLARKFCPDADWNDADKFQTYALYD